LTKGVSDSADLFGGRLVSASMASALFKRQKAQHAQGVNPCFEVCSKIRTPLLPTPTIRADVERAVPYTLPNS
jgi:hypothetical protein